MAKIIPLELKRAEHAERERQQAFAGFPWSELIEDIQLLLNPLTSRLPANKRWLVEESVYRLAYESFLLGIRASRKIRQKGRGGVGNSPWKEMVQGDMRVAGNRLINQTAEDFQLFQVLEKSLRQSVIDVMKVLMPRWLIRGAEYGLLLRKQRRI